MMKKARSTPPGQDLSSPGWRLAPLVLAQVAGSLGGFFSVCLLLPDSLAVSRALTASMWALALGALVFGVTGLRDDPAARMDALLLTGLGMVLGTMAVSTGYVLASYAAIPVDIVSFAESSFVNDIIKWRAGVPLYTPGPDNSAYPYMPGNQLLTYGIGLLFGDPPSITLMRHVVLGYSVLAACCAAFAADRLTLLVVVESNRKLRPMWWWVFACVAWLAVTDHRFNMFVHSLHNDALALLVTTLIFATAALHLHRPRFVTWLALAVLPVAGYLVKQSLLIWAPLLAVLFLISGGVAWRKVALMTVATGVLTAAVTWYGYQAWGGDDFVFWVFSTLGSRPVSLARSARNLLFAGGYAVAFLFWGRASMARGTSRPILALFLTTVGLFLVEAYTSGIGYTPNHLGPGVVLASVWGMLALVVAWPPRHESRGWFMRLAQRAVLAALPVFFLGGLELYREPRNPVPRDLARYVAAINAEFVGKPVDRVLLDMGSWPYFPAGVVMKDRAEPIAEHSAINQRSINRDMLAGTIARIRARRYDRILVRNIDGAAMPYDFQWQGTGVREAMLEEYRIVRRIPGVSGVREWWPPYLLDEVAVLEPREGAGGP